LSRWPWAAFASSNRHAIERRATELMLRDDEQDGAPPVVVDLAAQRIVITRSAKSVRPMDAGA
jgi:hypothetical protein